MNSEHLLQEIALTKKRYKSARGRENHLTSLVIQAYESRTKRSAPKAFRMPPTAGHRSKLGGFFGGLESSPPPEKRFTKRKEKPPSHSLEARPVPRYGAFDRLSEFTVKCIKSSEWIAEKFSDVPDFEWSCAILPLCKGLECEIHARVLCPLKSAASGDDLKEDCADKDFSKLAKYCSGRSSTPPELGSFAWFLSTAINSKSRRDRSRLLSIFFQLVAAMDNKEWVLSTDGLLSALEEVTKKFRNPAAHLESLSIQHYQECRDFLIGYSGIMWVLMTSTRLIPSSPPSSPQ